MQKYRWKTCFFLCHGNSIAELANRIDEFKDFDVLWGSMSSFEIHEDYTTKAGIDITVVYDCSTVKNNVDYELKVRIPRISKYLDSNKKHHYICNKTGRDNLFLLRESIAPEFNRKYDDQIIYTEDVGINPDPYCVSLHLYIATMCLLGINQVILFGADGGGKYGNNIQSYYKPDIIMKDKEQAGNIIYNMVGDTNNINSSFNSRMLCDLGFIPDVINCSPITTYNVFKQMDYNQTLEYLHNEITHRNSR